MIVIISIVSFLLDGILSKYLIGTAFLPLLTIVSIVIVYPYFRDNRFRYLKYISILGLLYDIVYFSTIFYNFFIFIILGFIVIVIDYLLSNNIYINVLMSITCIIFYRLINFLFYNIFNNYNISFIGLCESIYLSLMLNVIYCIIVYLLAIKYSKKHNILRSK